MPMILIIQTSALCLLVVGATAMAYYWFLAVVALLHRAGRGSPPSDHSHTFAVIIPAHDEEGMLADTLLSCDAIDYPKDKYRVFVVADNCSDRTASVAKGLGATCMERNDGERRGKGYALAFAFDRIDLAQWDAVLVMDADCRIEPNALRIFNEHLLRGTKALQANCLVGNPDDSPISYALALGNIIENELFYAPKSYLRLGVLLRGTGFVLHRDLLKAHPWHAHSIVEDIEYSLMLIRDRVAIRHIPDTSVYSRFPVDVDQLKVQRTRWASGNLGLGMKRSLRMMLDALAERNGALFDVGFTFLVLSRPLVLLTVCVSALLATCAFLLSPNHLSRSILVVSLMILASLVLYLILAILRVGLSRRRLALLFRAPSVALKMILISIRGLVSQADVWARTPR